MTVPSPTFRCAAARLLLCLGAAAAGGCAIVIKAPPDLAPAVQSPLPVAVTLPDYYVSGSFSAQLNGEDITPSFTLAWPDATATLDLPPGTYRLDVTGCWQVNLNLPIFFVMAPAGCSKASSSFTRIPTRLIVEPASVDAVVGRNVNATVRADPAPLLPVPVTVVASGGLAVVPSTLSIGGGSTSPVTFQVEGVAPGTGTLTASAPGWLSASTMLVVAPRLDSISPASGTPGTAVTLDGAGFTAGSRVRLGTATPVAVTPTAGGTRIQLALPATLAPGSLQVSVLSGGQPSSPLAFTVTTLPPDPVLFRATSDRIETVRFTPAQPFASSSFTLLGSVPATLSPGLLTVGLARSGSQLVRASASDLQLFTVGGTTSAPTLTLAATSSTAAGLSAVGAAAAVLPATLLRSTDIGIETWATSGNPLARRGAFNGGASAAGVALAVDATALRAWRSIDLGLEVYDVSNPAAPNRLANVTSNMTGTATGSALAWAVPGARLVRATGSSIDVIDTTALPPVRLGVGNTGFLSSVGVGVAMAGTRAVRATSVGIEVWDISTPAAPRRCAFRGGDLSATGVDVKVAGDVAFRATAQSLEAFDISDPACPATPSSTQIPAPVIFRAGLGLSATGVALALQP